MRNYIYLRRGLTLQFSNKCRTANDATPIRLHNYTYTLWLTCSWSHWTWWMFSRFCRFTWSWRWLSQALTRPSCATCAGLFWSSACFGCSEWSESSRQFYRIHFVTFYADAYKLTNDWLSLSLSMWYLSVLHPCPQIFNKDIDIHSILGLIRLPIRIGVHH